MDGCSLEKTARMAGIALAADQDTPTEWLDYGHVAQCTDVGQLERILRTLRSGCEGSYPELERRTEEQLKKFKPASALLHRTEGAIRLTQLDKEERASLVEDLGAWISSVKRDAAPTQQPELALPPVRNQTGARLSHQQPVRAATAVPSSTPISTKVSPQSTVKPARIPGHDFRAWDKFDAEQAAQDVDKEVMDGVASGGAPSPAITTTNVVCQRPAVLPSTNIPNLPEGLPQRLAMAEREKEKGNESFKAGDLEEALVYYTRSLHVHAMPATFNNRALALLKLKRLPEAASDCDAVLQQEPQNLKAFIRRASAYRQMGQLEKALKDANAVLQIAPGNRDGKKLLNELSRDIQNAAAIVAPPSTTKKRLTIQEDAGEGEDSDEEGALAPAVVQPSAVRPASPEATTVPHEVLVTKEQGRQYFLAGQFALAEAQYTTALEHLRHSSATNNNQLLSTLLNNRAACHLKTGDCRSCIADCTESLGVNPDNGTALLRRATAYEMLEKYQQAHDDFRSVLKTHPNSGPAIDGLSRASRVLRQEAKSAPSTPKSIASDGAASLSAPMTPAPAPVLNQLKVKYEKLKHHGNAMVKAGKFREAVEFYSRCIELDNTQPAAFNNRALCRLKTGDFSGAEADAATVLQSEPNNVKAAFRRGQALVALNRLSEAEVQLQTCLTLDPKNTVAEKELVELQTRLKAGSSWLPGETQPGPPAGKADVPSTDKVLIQEMANMQHNEVLQQAQPAFTSDSQEPTLMRRADRVADGNPAAAIPKTSASTASSSNSPARLAKVPSTPIEFMQGLQQCHRNPKQLAQYLRAVPVKNIRRMFSNRLQADHLMAYVRAMSCYAPANVACEYLQVLTTVERFDMVKQFLDPSDQQELAVLFEHEGLRDFAHRQQYI